MFSFSVTRITTSRYLYVSCYVEHTQQYWNGNDTCIRHVSDTTQLRSVHATQVSCITDFSWHNYSGHFSSLYLRKVERKTHRISDFLVCSMGLTFWPKAYNMLKNYDAPFIWFDGFQLSTSSLDVLVWQKLQLFYSI